MHITQCFGVSTTICLAVAEYYSSPPRAPRQEFVYLIDGSRIAGVSLAVPNRFKDHDLVRKHTVLRETYEINYPHAISSQFIAGCIHRTQSDRLTLYVNPNYLYDAAKVARYYQ